MSACCLTTHQIQFFRHNGFLKLPTPLPPESVARLKETIVRQIREEIAPVARDGQGRVRAAEPHAQARFAEADGLETAGKRQGYFFQTKIAFRANGYHGVLIRLKGVFQMRHGFIPTPGEALLRLACFFYKICKIQRMMVRRGVFI